MNLSPYQRRYFAYNCLRNWARKDAEATGANRATADISFKVYDKIQALEMHVSWRFESVGVIMTQWHLIKEGR